MRIDAIEFDPFILGFCSQKLAVSNRMVSGCLKTISSHVIYKDNM